MSAEKNYWNKRLVSRRQALRAALAGGGALAALSLVGCGDDDDDDDSSSGGGSGNQGVSGEPKAGGRLNWQGYGHPGTFDMFASQAGSSIASLVHSTLVASTFGRPPANGVDVDVEPDLAEALPEQDPDNLTYTYKLRAAKFHSGRDLTAEDVKYSWERYAFNEESIYKGAWLWLDSIEAPDDKTVVIKTKAPYADAVQIHAFQPAYILDKEHQEGPDVAAKLVGSGPFVFGSSNSGAETILKKNPDFYLEGLPLFDEVVNLPAADAAKQIADFTAKNTHYTYWFTETPRDQIRQNRPDAIEWSYPYAAFTLHIRNDQAPFNDKRVRQALSRSIDREAIRNAVSKGEGEDDQVFSPAFGPKWGFRKPSELGDGAANWEYNPEEAKKLLSAANVSLPIESEFSHLDASLRGTIDTDLATLTEAGWKQLGIANITDKTVTPGQFFSTIAIGDYSGLTIGAGLQFPVIGTQLKDYFYSPPGGPTVPTTNWSRVQHDRVNELFDLELTQFDFEERRSTFQELEEIFAEEMFVIPWSTTSHTHFTDPSVKGCVVPVYAYGGSAHYLKFWGFGE
jgi:peptide/nickel transport system substrate-binding protein